MSLRDKAVLLTSCLLLAAAVPSASFSLSAEASAPPAPPQKTVLITGGNRGLGRELCNAFSSRGWRVLATARDVATLPDSVEHQYALDLSLGESVRSLADAINDDVQPPRMIDCLVHNAGFNPKDRMSSDPAYFASTFRIDAFDADNVAESCYINALRPMELTGRILPSLAEDGCVLAISSWFGSISAKETEGMPGQYAYAGSKALMNMCVRGLAQEFEADVKSERAAVAINPGWMATDMGGTLRKGVTMGGMEAPLEPEVVAGRIADMVHEGIIQKNNGKFLNSDRTEHEW